MIVDLTSEFSSTSSTVGKTDGGETTFKEIKMVKGNEKEADKLINLFDKYSPEKAVLVTPHLHD